MLDDPAQPLGVYELAGQQLEVAAGDLALQHAELVMVQDVLHLLLESSYVD